MPVHGEESSSSQNKGIDIIRALALGDVSLKDAHEKLKHDAVDTLELLLAIVSQAQKAAVTPVSSRLSAQIQRFSKPTPADVIEGIVHKVPFLPVMINGTLYDPEDIKRFNGMELHFLPTRDHLIAIDDRSVIARWWESSYLSSLMHPQVGRRGNTKIEPRDFPPFPPLDPSIPEPSVPYNPGASGSPGTLFWEHDDFRGDNLYLDKNRGYYDLTEVGRGFLGFGDWNDIISAVQLGTDTGIAVLHEHIHWTGSTMSVTWNATQLAQYGWNDRASSVETW